MPRITVQKTDENTAITAIKATYFPTGKTELVYDDTVTPIIDEITPYTDAIAAHITNINPIRSYPPTTK